MKKKNKSLRIAAIGDLHAHEQARDLYRELFEEISEKADILVICGDLTNLGLPEEARHLAEDLKSCAIPVLAVLGNHDYHHSQEKEIKQILSESGVIFLDEDETFELDGVGFAGIKGFGGGFGQYMVSAFGEPGMKKFVEEAVSEAMKLEYSLKQLETKKKVVVLHYSPIQETVKTEPIEIQAFLGCSRLAEVIDRFDVSAVFHGHAHHGFHEGKTKKGVPVYNVAAPLMRKKNQVQPYTIIEI